MTVPKHFRFTVRGEFVGTPEQFSFGFHMSNTQDAGTDAHINDIDEDAVSTALVTFFQNSNGKIPDSVRATDWRAYEIGVDNKMVGNPLIHLFPGNTCIGTTTTRYPPQIAAVVTTVAANRGPGRFGRFYLPTGAALAADARMSVTDAANLVTGATQLLKDVSDAIDMGGVLRSATGLNISQSSGGHKQEIDHVECGRVLDTLRNRRKSLDEARVIGGHIDW